MGEVERFDDGQAVLVRGFIDQYLAIAVVLLADVTDGGITVKQIGIDILQFRPDDPAGIDGVAEEVILAVGEVGKGLGGTDRHAVAGDVFQPVVIVGAEPAPAGIGPADLVPAGPGGSGDGNGLFL